MNRSLRACRSLKRHPTLSTAATALLPDDTQMQYLSFYRYFPLADAEGLQALRTRLLAEWAPMGVLGRCYIAREGVNAQMALPVSSLDAWRRSARRVFAVSATAATDDTDGADADVTDDVSASEGDHSGQTGHA